MTDKIFTNEADVRAALTGAMATTAMAMALDGLDESLVAEALRNYGFALNSIEMNWTISEDRPLFWVEIVRPVEEGSGDLFDWAAKEDPNLSDQFAVTYEMGSSDARFALLTQSSETATLFKMFFQ